MPTVTVQAGDLCADFPVEFTATDSATCDTIQWAVYSVPDGVSDDDVYFSAPNSIETFVTVPTTGRYVVGYTCCEVI